MQGVSILSRKREASYLGPFLVAMEEAAAGAAAQSKIVAARSEAAALRLRAACDNHERKEAAACDNHQRKEAAAAKPQSSKADEVAGMEGASERAGTDQGAEEFFMKRIEEKKLLDAAGLGKLVSVDEVSGDHEKEERAPFMMSDEEQSALEERFRLLHASALIAKSVSDAAAPLIRISPPDTESISAMSTCKTALGALKLSTAASESDALLMEEMVKQTTTGPPQPQVPKLLPAIAEAWPSMCAALKDSRTAVVESALALVSAAAGLGGGVFMGRRFQQEVLPVLFKLLSSGTAHVSARTSSSLSFPSPKGGPASRLLLLSPGGSDSHMHDQGQLAPGAVQRVRLAALECCTSVCSSPEAASAVKGRTWELAQACIPFLGSSYATELNQAASKLLMSLSSLDQDAVWLLLFDVVYNSDSRVNTKRSSESKSPPSKRPPAPPLEEPAPQTGPYSFPPLKQLLPPASSSQAKATRYKGAAPEIEVSTLAHSLLQQVGSSTPAMWHSMVKLNMCAYV
eukprot:gene11610-34316_t